MSKVTEVSTMAIDESFGAAADEYVAVMDAMYRFGSGVDGGDSAMLATVFSEDAVVDFGPCGRAMDLDFPVLTGSEAIVSFLRATARTQRTSHVITNGRVTTDGERGALRVLVDATHLPKANHPRRCRMMNWYDVDLVKDQSLWRIRRLVISNIWFSGDVQVLLDA